MIGFDGVRHVKASIPAPHCPHGAASGAHEIPLHVRVITCTSLLDLAGLFSPAFFCRATEVFRANKKTRRESAPSPRRDVSRTRAKTSARTGFHEQLGKPQWLKNAMNGEEV